MLIAIAASIAPAGERADGAIAGPDKALRAQVVTGLAGEATGDCHAIARDACWNSRDLRRLRKGLDRQLELARTDDRIGVIPKCGEPDSG